MTEVLEQELKYCLYARKSTEGDEKQALSIDSQIEESIAIIVAPRRKGHAPKGMYARTFSPTK